MLFPGRLHWILIFYFELALQLEIMNPLHHASMVQTKDFFNSWSGSTQKATLFILSCYNVHFGLFPLRQHTRRNKVYIYAQLFTFQIYTYAYI